MDVVDHVEMINLDMFEKFKQRHEHIIALLGKRKAMKLISQHVRKFAKFLCPVQLQT